MAKTSRNKMILHRIQKMRTKVKINTQKIREEMLINLQELFSLAKQQAQNKKLELEQRQKWIRVASYTAQVVNSLTKSFDEAQVTKDLEKLEKLIGEAVAKEKDRGVNTTS